MQISFIKYWVLKPARGDCMKFDNIQGILAPCHPERREGSSSPSVIVCPDGRFFAALRMTGLDIPFLLVKLHRVALASLAHECWWNRHSECGQTACFLDRLLIEGTYLLSYPFPAIL